MKITKEQREKVARLVNPTAWRYVEFKSFTPDGEMEQRAIAETFEKADEIIEALGLEVEE